MKRKTGIIEIADPNQNCQVTINMFTYYAINEWWPNRKPKQKQKQNQKKLIWLLYGFPVYKFLSAIIQIIK